MTRKFWCFLPSLMLSGIRQTKRMTLIDKSKIYEFVGIGAHIETKTDKSRPVIFVAKFYADGSPVCDPELISLSTILNATHRTDSFSWLISNLLALPSYSKKLNVNFISGGVNTFTSRLKNAQMRLHAKAGNMQKPFATLDVKSLDFDFLKRNALNLSNFGYSNLEHLIKNQVEC